MTKHMNIAKFFNLRFEDALHYMQQGTYTRRCVEGWVREGYRHMFGDIPVFVYLDNDRFLVASIEERGAA